MVIMLAKIRAKLGLTQRDIAQKVNVHYNTIYNLEAGVYNPRLPLARAIVDVVNTAEREVSITPKVWTVESLFEEVEICREQVD